MAISPAVQDLGKKLESKIATIDKTIEKVQTGTKKDAGTRVQKSTVFGEPTARQGESVLTSRGYQFQRAIGVRTGILKPEHAKVEMEMHERLHKTFVVGNNFEVTNDNITQATGGVMMAPLGTEFMGGNYVDETFRAEIKSLSIAGTANADPDEMAWVRRKSFGGSAKTAQSWLDETLGGSLVAPPEFGELIQLLRNKDALMNAGARTVPLPPSGRLKFPRQTSPSTGYWIGENTSITSSNFNTGTLLLSAKKVAALVTLPNELIRFASPASEAVLRADMTKTLSLTADKAFLEGQGSDNVPQGILNTPGIVTVAPSSVTGNGNTMSPQDLYLFPSAVEANNAEFQGYILRPEYFYQFVGARAGIYNGSAVVAQGQFTYNQFRELGDGFGKILAGYKATTTAQVSITRVKGTLSTGTYLVGGQWDDAIIAMFGTIEFAQAFQGDTAFAQDQVVVRAILTCDFGLRHPGAFAVADTLIQTIGV